MADYGLLPADLLHDAMFIPDVVVLVSLVPEAILNGSGNDSIPIPYSWTF